MNKILVILCVLMLPEIANSASIYTFSGQITSNRLAPEGLIESMGRGVGQTVTFQLLLDFDERGYNARYSTESESFTKSYHEDRIDYAGYYQDTFLAEWAGGDSLHYTLRDREFIENYGIQWFELEGSSPITHQPIVFVGNFGVWNNSRGFDINIVDWEVGDSFAAAESWGIEGWQEGSTFYLARNTGWSVEEMVLTDITPVNAVPIPAAAWLFGSALLGLGALKRKANSRSTLSC